VTRHSFAVGQSVELVRHPLNGKIPPGRYTIQRLLPNDGADREYRIRNVRDGHERVVRESQLLGHPA
jgi:hypothetical protein